MPQLTGIRAVAFLMVFLFHSWFGGYFLWCGVDLFFVLSGYLITGILLEQKHSSSYFRNFYISRVVRIFPPFYAVLLLAALLFRRMDGTQMAVTALFSANLYLPFAHRLNAPPSFWALSPYWSLALEEQFYLFWPLLVLKLSARQLAWLCLGMMVLAPVARLLTLQAFPSAEAAEAVFMLPLNRMDVLAGGALIALGRQLSPGNSPLWARLGAGVAAASLLLLAALVALRSDFRQSAGSAIFTTLGYSTICLLMCGVILYLVHASSGPVVKLLSWGPVVYLGTVSYTMYLLHYVVIVVLESGGTTKPGWVLSVGAFSVTLGIAALSWHLMERPLKRLRQRHLASGQAFPSVVT
jgi:peptidoglycan/LPS O-acetylase OafA/YrhL